MPFGNIQLQLNLEKEKVGDTISVPAEKTGRNSILNPFKLNLVSV